MKKFLVYFILPITVITSLFLGYKSINGRSTFNSLYLVPEDAAIIIESDDIFYAWNEIIHSDAWFHLQNIESLAELNKELQRVDSLINNNKLLFRVLGNRKFTFSYHPVQYHKYDFLLITDIGKATRIKNISGLIKNLMGENITINSRKYLSNEIIEIHDKNSGEIMYVSLLHDKAVFTYASLLIERAIEEQSEMNLARKMKFLEVYEKADGKGLLSLYLAKEQFLEMLNTTAGMEINELNKNLNSIFYAGIYFNISSDGLISLQGYASYNDTLRSNVFNLLSQGKTDYYSQNIIPGTLASVTKININDPIEYFHRSLKQSGENEYKTRLAGIERIEKKLKINIEKNLLSWIDKEIVLLQTKPSNLGKANEFAAILHAKNTREPKKNLAFIYTQIEKHTPVKVRSAYYHGYTIAYISLPGFIKLIFGNTLEKIDKPYITQIDDNVIISNHPQTLKNIIDDYINRNTLEHSIDYYNFHKHFSSLSSAGTYIEIPVVFNNMKGYFDSDSWSNLKKNEKYITSFSDAGLVIDNQDHLFSFDFKAQYKRTSDIYTRVNYSFYDLFNPQEKQNDELSDSQEYADSTAHTPIIITDLDASKQEQYFSDSVLQLTVELKNGLKHGTFKEYFHNGNLKIKGKFKEDKKTGNWKYYHEDGNFAFKTEYKVE